MKFPVLLLSLCTVLPPARAQFTLVETGGTFRTDATNLALTATAVGQDELGYDTHFIANINDGTYGNSSSWIGEAENHDTFGSWVGLAFSAPTNVASFAFGRDNTGTYLDRAGRMFNFSYTTSSQASILAHTASWINIASMDYQSAAPPSPTLRHLFNLTDPLIGATGLRIYTASGIAEGNAIDELEVYATAASVIPEPSTYASLVGVLALGLAAWRRHRPQPAP